MPIGIVYFGRQSRLGIGVALLRGGDILERRDHFLGVHHMTIKAAAALGERFLRACRANGRCDRNQRHQSSQFRAPSFHHERRETFVRRD